jgi:3-oxoacyl-[acyl-carrier protein] reductase
MSIFPPAPDKTVLVTGASSGIGRATALAFARAGFDVVCHGRRVTDRLEATLAEVTAAGRRASALTADFSIPAELETFLAALDGLVLDSLVNNAGAYVAYGPAEALDLARLTATFVPNAFAPILVAVRAFAGMAARGRGRIVNVSSVAAKYGGSWHSLDYGCAKRALEGAGRTLAREGAKRGVLVNTVRPGVIDTPFHHGIAKNLTARAALVPMGRLGLAEEVARTILFLGGDDNTFITGQTLGVTGGE